MLDKKEEKRTFFLRFMQIQNDWMCNARNSSLSTYWLLRFMQIQNEMKHTSVKHFKNWMKWIPHALYSNLWHWTIHQADGLILYKTWTCIWFLNNCSQKAIISALIEQTKSKKHIYFGFVYCSYCIINKLPLVNAWRHLYFPVGWKQYTVFFWALWNAIWSVFCLSHNQILPSCHRKE